MHKKKNVATLLREGFRRLNWMVFLLFCLGLLGMAALFWGLRSTLWQNEAADWLPALALAAATLLALGLLMGLVIHQMGRQTQAVTLVSIDEELNRLRVASDRARALQQMASTISATLSFERVMDAALDVSSLVLVELGMPAQSLVGAVFLYEEGKLTPVAARRFAARDFEQEVRDNAGILAEAFKSAEPISLDKPAQDPELRKFIAFHSCQSAVCVPLRAGFQIFGAMIVGTEFGVQFDQDHLEFFKAVADQAVIALQNAQLYQALRAEKQRLIEADEEARKELARSLHDGPTQSIAAIAMHINFVRSLMVRNPRQALDELIKVERLAKQTSKEIRSMLFALRPLVLESDGLAAAVEAILDKIRETDKLKARLVGGEYDKLLDRQTQMVVFSIIEEALGNARKHAAAKVIEVRFWQEGDLFVARVQDDGVGFDVGEVNANYTARGSLGMVNMRERAERIEGSIKVDSVPGRGTAVTLVVPIKKRSQLGDT